MGLTGFAVVTAALFCAGCVAFRAWSRLWCEMQSEQKSRGEQQQELRKQLLRTQERQQELNEQLSRLWAQQQELNEQLSRMQAQQQGAVWSERREQEKAVNDEPSQILREWFYGPTGRDEQ